MIVTIAAQPFTFNCPDRATFRSVVSEKRRALAGFSLIFENPRATYRPRALIEPAGAVLL